MADDLQKLIAARKRQARDNKIPEKIEAIATHLGRNGSYIDGGGEGTLCVTFDRGNFWIVTQGVLPGREVFAQRGKKPDIECYIPGEWEKRLSELATLAEAERARKVATEESRREAERLTAEADLRRRFGL